MPARASLSAVGHWYRYSAHGVIALLLLSLACAEWQQPCTARFEKPEVYAPAGVLNIAHRGASGHAPEHTFAAYDRALELGADYIEQDLQLTKDGVLVVLHDATLDRTARGPAEDCTGPVIEKTLSQVKRCDVGSWFNTAYPQYAHADYVGLRVPTLDEVFARYRKRASYYIETKNPEAAPGMEQKLLALLHAHDLRSGAAREWTVLIQSFSAASLRTLHDLDPSLPLVQLFGERSDSSAAIRLTLDSVAEYAIGIGPNARAVDAALVAAARSRCLELHPYTVNDTAAMRVLVDVGVSGMFTNFPDRLHALGARGPGDGAAVSPGQRSRDAGARCRGARGSVANRDTCVAPHARGDHAAGVRYGVSHQHARATPRRY